MSGGALGDTFFRHAYGHVVALLVRRFGPGHLQTAEDAVQSALAAALADWTTGGVPGEPLGWLYRVAERRLIGELRHRATLERLAPPLADTGSVEVSFAGEITDALLRMLFVCCDERLAPELQLALALKVPCGFEVREIAARLFLREATVYKRIDRARHQLRAASPSFDLPQEAIAARLPGVRRVLYAMFAEGYLSFDGEPELRADLCAEAIRLATLLAEHPIGEGPESAALVALMHLHAARQTARVEPAGGLVLLQDQDRTRWDGDHVALGLAWLAGSAAGETFSRYHAEAGIAAEHCLAPSLAQTRWDRIVELYASLEQIAPSPLHRLNRAVATAEWRGPEAGLAVLGEDAPPSWLAGSYQWFATLSDLHHRAGHAEPSARYRALALDAAPSEPVRRALARRLGPE